MKERSYDIVTPAGTPTGPGDKETITLQNGETVTITETETEITIEAQDWGAEGAFGARLEISTAFATRETALKAFAAVCAALEA